MSSEKLFELVATAIILREPYKKGIISKYLIVHRADHERTFPGMWTVPGGKLSTNDYTRLPRETEHYWYNVMEKALRREVREETGLDIKNIWYLTSLARVTDKNHGSLVLSFVADYAGGKLMLEPDLQNHTWLTYEEAKKYNLIDGILDELYMTERVLNGDDTAEWQRAK